MSEWMTPIFATSEILQALQSILEFIVKIVAIIGVPSIAWKAQQAAIATNQVKKTLAVNTTRVDEKLDTIHSLVNNAMTVQLRINYEQAKRIALENPLDTTAKLLATAAEKLYNDQVAAQENMKKSL